MKQATNSDTMDAHDSDATPQHDRCGAADHHSSWFWCRWFVLILLCSLPGCRGCQQSGENLTREELEKRAKEKRESLELSELLALPADSETKTLTAKPGHWIETQQQFKSNREDLQVVALGSVARGTELAQLPGTNVVNEFTRRTSLPKGQTKTVDLQFFVPFSGVKEDALSMVSTRLSFRTELLSWPLMTPILQSPDIKPANELKEHEFQLVALSPQALSYEYLTVLDAVYWRGDELMSEERTRSYFVSLVKPVDGKYAFPRSMLTMTAIAAIVWDDVSPGELSEEQQNAIIDWVHWGGQLIVSGPSSWSRLQNSFLSPYMPATSADVTEFVTDDFTAMSDTWVVDDRAANASPESLQVIGPPLGGLRFTLKENGQWLPGTGELVAESQVGRGRIVLTSFPLREPRVYRWKYFSSFLSTGLLRRQPREIRRSTEDRLLAQYWAKPFEHSEHDARMHSNVRILTRDLPLSNSAGQALAETEVLGMGGDAYSAIGEGDLNAPSLSDQVAESMQWGGRGAAWNDYSGLTHQALSALKAAAGIELPSRRTILYLLTGYLICLVPLNWIVFRMLGRLEFAWLAAPVMALAGVLVVTKVARLDIGFARRTTEISVLELHGDHARGHLTQYLALYTSLSTNYAIEFPENGSVVLPLGDIARSQRRAAATTRNLRTNYGRSEGVILEPLTVYSNSTEMLHAEQMIPLKGGLRLGKRADDGPPALKNDTGLKLMGAMVIQRTQQGALNMAWVGGLESGQATTLNYAPVSTERLWEHWESEPVTQPEAPPSSESCSDSDALWIGGVMQEIVRKTPLMPGQTRLFAYTDDRPSALTVTPADDQFDGRCVIVAHLTPQTLGAVVPDLNILSRPVPQEPDATGSLPAETNTTPVVP